MSKLYRRRGVSSTLKSEFEGLSLLLKDYPPIAFTLWTLSLVAANIFANKELIAMKYLSLDCGTAFSWIIFLCADITCRHYGSKATIELSIIALIINLTSSAFFALMAQVGGNWGAFYDTGSAQANDILNSTFSGSPYIVMGSSVAFLTSSVINALLHSAIARTLRGRDGDKVFGRESSLKKSKSSNKKAESFGAFAVASYLSTFIAQFCDNFLFSLIVSKVLFGWTWTQVLFCAIFQAVIELLCEVVGSPLGFWWVRHWERERVGERYILDASC